MKQSSVIFVIFLIISISQERQSNANTKYLLKEKPSNSNYNSFLETSANLQLKEHNHALIGNDSSNTQTVSDSSKVNFNFNSKSNSVYNKSTNEDDEYSSQKQIECNASNCFYPNGRCVDNGTCECTKEYASFKQEGESKDHYCAYERKKQLVSFLLELFLPFGVGHFYSGRILIGVLKIIVCFSQCIIAGIGFCLAKDAGMLTVIILLVIGCVYISWELVDIILIALNVYKDGNGVPLASW